MRPERMSFGIFMAPFHRLGDNPSLALRRDIELIEALDALGYDEAWIGEHHSAGWELIADPAIMIAAAAERTKRIMLGSGVVSLPYHHPLLVADRFVQLDHLTRGRSMLGVGPGALASDAYMLGIDPVTQRPRMDEALGVIMRLLQGEVVDHKSDWFELRQARLQLLPFTRPCFPIAVASQVSPAGMMTAGRYGAGVISLGAGTPGGKAGFAKHWGIAEEYAAKAGKQVRREEWRLMMPMYLAESVEEAIHDAEPGWIRDNTEYFQNTIARPFSGNPMQSAIDADAMLVGDPDSVSATIERLLEASGGFGGILFMATEWTSRQKQLASYELFARYVAPRFQGSLVSVQRSQQFVSEHRRDIFSPDVAAIANAFKDANREMPPELYARRGAQRPQE